MPDPFDVDALLGGSSPAFDVDSALQKEQETGVFAGLKRGLHGLGVPTSWEELKGIPEQTGRALLSYPVPYLPAYEAITKGPTREGRAAGAQALLGPAGAAQYEQAEKAVEAPTKTEAALRGLAALTPIAGPMAVSPGEAVARGDLSGAAAETAVLGGSLWLGHKYAKGKAGEGMPAEADLLARKKVVPRVEPTIDADALLGGEAVTAKLPPPVVPTEPVAPLEASLADIIASVEEKPAPAKVWTMEDRVKHQEIAKTLPEWAHKDEVSRLLDDKNLTPEVRDAVAAEVQRVSDGKNYLSNYEDVPIPKDLASQTPDAGAEVRQWTRLVDNGSERPMAVTWFEDPKSGEIRVAGGVTKYANGEAHEWAHGRSIGEYDAPTTLNPLRALVEHEGWKEPAEITKSAAYKAREAELRGKNEGVKVGVGPEDGRAQGTLGDVVPGRAPAEGGVAQGGRVVPEDGGRNAGPAEVAAPDVTDPYIYEALNPQEPRSSIARVVQKLTPRAALPLLTAIEKKVPVVGQAIAETSRRYIQRFERGAMRWGQEATRLKGELERAGIKWEDMVDAAERGDTQGRLGGYAKRFRVIDDHFLQRGTELGIIPKENVVPNHYPHQPIDKAFFTTEAQAKRLSEAKKIPLEQAIKEVRAERGLRMEATSPFEATLQVRREGGFTEYRKDFEGYLQYVMDAERKFADVEHFGKNGEKLRDMTDGIEDQATHDRVKALMGRLRGLPQDEGMVGKVSGKVRGLKSFASLGLAPVSQVAGIVPTVATGGVANTARGLWKIATGGRGMNGLKTLGENWREAKIEAMPALMANISTEMSEHLGSTALTSQSGARAGISKAYQKGKNVATAHLRATNWSDGAQRVVAYHTGKEFMPRIAAEAKGGSKSAQGIMRDIRIDWKTFDPKNPEHVKIAAKAFSDFTQHRTGIADMPGWASSPLGKLAMQFKNVAYKQTIMTGKAVKWAVQGRPGPLVRMAVAGALVGTGISSLKNMVKGYGIKPEDPESWKEAFGQAKKQNWAPSHPLYAAAHGFAMAGLGGIVDDVINKAANSPTPILDLAGGPSYEYVRDASQIITTTRDKGLAKGGKVAGAAALRHSVPILGREAARELKDFSADDDSKIPERAGWVGRTRDVIEGEQDVLSAVRGGFVTGEKSARRQASEKRRLTAEDLKGLSAEKKALLPPTEKPQEVKDAASEKRLEKLRYALPIIEALKSGDEKKARAIAAEAAAAGVRISHGDVVGWMRALRASQAQEASP